MKRTGMRVWTGFLAFTMLLSSLSAGFTPSKASAAAISVQKIAVEADAHVQESRAADNFGANATMIVGAGRETYLRFDVSGITDAREIKSVTLDFFRSGGGSTNTMEIYKVLDDTWAESELTWNNRPTAANSQVEAVPFQTYVFGAVSNVAYEGVIDITEAVREEVESGDGKLSLMLTTTGRTSPGLDLFAKENSSSKIPPTLAVTIEQLSNAERAAVDADGLAAFVVDQSTVKDRMVLPSTGSAWNSSIVWSSSKPDVISNNGEVTRPLYEEGDESVVLTAMVIQADATEIRTFTLHVPAKGQLSQVRLIPVADAYVQSGMETNFGSAHTLIAGANRETLLRYDLSGLPDPSKIISATLDFYQISGGSGNTLEVYRSGDDAWEESAVNWSNKPASNATSIASYEAVNVSKAIITGKIDVADALRAEDDGLLSLIIKGDNARSGINIASKEMSDAVNHPNAFPPTIVVTVEGLADTDKVTRDAQQLDALGLNGTSVTNNLDLPTLGSQGSTIVWTSDKPGVIASSGVVTRPLATQEDAVVHLTATITSGEESVTRTYTVMVPKKELLTTVKLVPVADAHVHSGSTATNYGSATTLIIGAGRETFLRYDLSGIADYRTIQSATFDYYQLNAGSGNTMEFYHVGDDTWLENTISYNSKPVSDPDLIKTYHAISISNTAIQGAIDLTDAVQAEVKGDGKLSLKLTTPSGAAPGINIASKEDTASGHFAPTLVLTLVHLTDAERVEQDMRALDALDNIAVTDNVALPTIGSRFSDIAWSSDTPAVIANDGAVTRPLDNELDAVVKLTATITFGSVTKQRVITIRVPKLPSASPYLHASLGRLITLAEDTAATAVIGSNPGERPQGAKDTFTLEIQLAKSAYALNDPAQDKSAIFGLTNAAKAFLDKAVLSDAIVDEKTNARAYSAYRATLVSLVWEAKAALLTEPEMFTNGAKVALQDQIDRAEAALSGEYTAPFDRNREFLKPRPDEDLQFVTEYFSRAPSYGTSTYGLAPALKWYKSQHVFADAYLTVEIVPEADAFVNKGSAGTNYGSSDGLVVNNPPGVTERSPVLRFNLSDLSDTITNATFRFTNKKADNNPINVYLLDNDSWLENQITYNAMERDASNNLVFGPLIGKGMLGTQNAFSLVDLTDAAIKEQLGEKKLSIAITQMEGSSFPGEFYSKEAAVQDRRPRLITKVNTVDQQKLIAAYAKANGLAEEMATGASAGGEVGQYPQAAITRLTDAIAAARQSIAGNLQYEIGAAIVELYNAMKHMRDSQVLRSDVEASSDVFFPAGGMEALRNRIEQFPLLTGEFDKVKQISDQYTLQEVKDYGMLLDPSVTIDEKNARFKMWSDVTSQNFTPPAGAVNAKLELTLPSLENEADGLGHVWLDALRIYPSNATEDLTILNSGFDQAEEDGHAPKYWEQKVIKGSPVFQWEDRTNFVRSGSHSIYLENSTSGDEGAWVYTQSIPIEGSVPHTLNYSSKIDGKLKNGAQIKLTFFNANGVQVGSYTSTNNMKASVGGNGTNLTFQADAIVYAVTGNVMYAEKAKYNMLYFLQDHAQGIESWLVNNVRPDGYDAYGAVQTGRNAASLATAYSLIKNAGVFSAEEKDKLLSLVDYLLRNMSDLRDRSELTAYEAQVNTGNWETDMSAGASFLAMAFPELPNARQWLHNGRIVLEGQLANTLKSDGSWPESIRYHVAAIQRFSTYAKALRNVTGEDWFRDSDLKKMFEFLMLVQTTPYEEMNNRISTPNYGDHMLTPGTDFAVLGNYFNEIAATNQQLGVKLYQTWLRAGQPVANYWGEAIALENFFNPIEFTNATNTRLQLGSTNELNPAGLYLFRNNFGRSNETFMTLIANKTAIGHGHYDEGSFILYANGSPLIMDPGIESYFDSSKNWYVSSSAHSTVQFASGSDYVNTPLTAEQLGFQASHGLDMAKVKVNHPSGAGAGSQTRTMAYVKNGIDAFIVWDQMKGSTVGARFNLPIAASATTIAGNKATSTGYYGTDLETTVLQPAAANIQQEFARAHPDNLPNSAGLNYLRITASAGQNFLTVLYPKQSGQEGLLTEQLAITSPGVDGYKLSKADQQSLYVLANNADGDQNVAIASEEALVDMSDGVIYETSGGTVNVKAKANSLGLFKPASLADGKPTTIELKGDSSTYKVPESGVRRYLFAGDIIDQYGDLMLDKTIQWSVSDASEGITIDQRGILTVTASAKAGIISVAAVSGDAEAVLAIPLAGDGSVDPTDPTGPTGPTNPTAPVEPDAGAIIRNEDGSVRITWSQASAQQGDKTTFILTENQLKQALELATDGSTGMKTIRLEVQAAVSFKEVGLQLPRSLFNNSKQSIRFLLTTQAGTLAFTDTMLNALALTDDSTVELVVGRSDASMVDTSIQARIGTKPIVELYLLVNKRHVEWSNPNSPVTVSIPYTPTEEERNNSEKLTVWYLNGQSTPVPNGKYDEKAGAVIFSTDHFSAYAVVFVPKTFDDLGKHPWARHAIEVLASKGIVNGTSATDYNPAAQVTRADFLKLLISTLELKSDASSDFADVKKSDYYYKEVMIARALGIVKGSGDNLFHPKKSITRQEMMVMTARALESAGKLEAGQATGMADRFKDWEKLDPYAIDSAAALINLDIVKGNGQLLNPAGVLTRAEAAVLIYSVYQLK